MKKATLLVFLCLIALALLTSCKKDEAAAPAANAAAPAANAAAPAANAAAPAADAAPAPGQDPNKDGVENSIDWLIDISTKINKAAEDAKGDCEKFGSDADKILMDNKSEMVTRMAIIERAEQKKQNKYPEKAKKVTDLMMKHVADLGTCINKGSVNASKAMLTLDSILKETESMTDFLNDDSGDWGK